MNVRFLSMNRYGVLMVSLLGLAAPVVEGRALLPLNAGVPTIVCETSEVRVAVFYEGEVFEEGEFDWGDLGNLRHRIRAETIGAEQSKSIEYQMVVIIHDGGGNETIQAFLPSPGLKEVAHFFYDHEEPYLNGFIQIENKTYRLTEKSQCRGPVMDWESP